MGGLRLGIKTLHSTNKNESNVSFVLCKEETEGDVNQVQLDNTLF